MLNCKKKFTQTLYLNLNSSGISKKLELFATDIRGQLLHFPKYLVQRKANTGIKHIQLIEKLMDNFEERFDDFVLREQLLCCSFKTLLI